MTGAAAGLRFESTCAAAGSGRRVALTRVAALVLLRSAPFARRRRRLTGQHAELRRAAAAGCRAPAAGTVPQPAGRSATQAQQRRAARHPSARISGGGAAELRELDGNRVSDRAGCATARARAQPRPPPRRTSRRQQRRLADSALRARLRSAAARTMPANCCSARTTRPRPAATDLLSLSARRASPDRARREALESTLAGARPPGATQIGADASRASWPTRARPARRAAARRQTPRDRTRASERTAAGRTLNAAGASQVGTEVDRLRAATRHAGRRRPVPASRASRAGDTGRRPSRRASRSQQPCKGALRLPVAGQLVGPLRQPAQ
ncbi:MAG: hypothetical protein MZV65_20315 [Chromatiales bacterium]|nr:hypothetical protein [Chromatiales bacterium]